MRRQTFHGGSISVNLTGGNTAQTLSLLNQHNIEVADVKRTDTLTISFRIKHRDLAVLQRLAQKRGDTLQVNGITGIYWKLVGIVKRPVFLTGIAVVLLLTVYVPNRVFFFEVKGNDTLHDSRILAAAEKCGLTFGADRRALRSEQIKNSLLQSIPQLQWVGVNTAGCLATIEVKERTDTQIPLKAPPVCSIVAQRDGVIHSCTVTKGSMLCKIGQAVKAGQKLVSGYTDHGLLITAQRAEAEVTALTQREIEVLSPMKYSQKGLTMGSSHMVSLIIGKKQIFLFGSSGIPGATCVKMYKEYYATLPGGFSLPVGIAMEERTYYSGESTETAALDVDTCSRRFAEEYIQSQMIGGSILWSSNTGYESEGVYYFYGKYACLEMIGREQNEEIITNYGESD